MKAPSPRDVAAAMTAAALLATPFIASWEAKRNVTYADIVGIPTACYGHTGADVGPIGTVKSDAQCAQLLRADVRMHMEGALRCTPGLAARRREMLAAATSLTFNIGVPAYCRSTPARLFNAGRWREACDSFRLWSRAGGRDVPGLIRRREAERALCLKGIPA